MCNINENKTRIIKYLENKKEFSISYLLEKKDALKIYGTLFEFCGQLNAKSIQAEFFLDENTLKKEIEEGGYSKILKKTKELNIEYENKTNIKGYLLKDKFNKEFLKRFFRKHYPISLIEMNIFNQKNKKIAEFTKEHLIIFYNLTEKQIKNLKQKIKESEAE